MSYDVGKDGQGQEVGSCSVRLATTTRGGRDAERSNASPFVFLTANDSYLQLDFRRTDVTAKARLTYFKGKFTEVRCRRSFSALSGRRR